MFSQAYSIIQLGGPIMWFLLVASIIAIGVFVERLFFFRRCTMNLDHFFAGLFRLLQEKRFDEALERCDEGYGPAVQVVKAAIKHRHLPKSELKEFAQEVGQLQVPRLESHITILSTIAYVAPLLGLLGTVTGMIKTFMQIHEAAGTAPVSELASGIWEALIATAGGLTIGIPCYVAYNFLAARVNWIIRDVERAGIEVVQQLKDESLEETTKIR
jgi:biopolymer transport protein ExbB